MMDNLAVVSLAFLCTWMIWFSAQPTDSALVFEQTRYVNDTNSSFLISTTSELTCNCKGAHGEINTNETYYKVFVDDVSTLSFTRYRRSIHFCNQNVTFYAYKASNRRYDMAATCFAIVSTYEQFSAIQVEFSTSDMNWNDGDGGFDLDGKNVKPRTPCSNCGGRCTCPADTMVYDMGMRTCCYPGVPRPSFTTGFAAQLSPVASLLMVSWLFIRLNV